MPPLPPDVIALTPLTPDQARDPRLWPEHEQRAGELLVEASRIAPWCARVGEERLTPFWIARCPASSAALPALLPALRRAGCVQLLVDAAGAARAERGEVLALLRRVHEAGLRAALLVAVAPGGTDAVRALVLEAAPYLDDVHFRPCGELGQEIGELVEALSEAGIPVQPFGDAALFQRLTEARGRALARRWEAATIRHGPLRLSVDLEQQTNALHGVGDRPLSGGPGIGACLWIDGRMLELTSGRWRVHRDEEGGLHLESALLFAPARLQLHAIPLPDHALLLRLDLVAERALHLPRLRVGLHLPDTATRYHTLAGEGSLPLDGPAGGDASLSRPPLELLMLAGDEGGDAGALLLRPADGLYWEAIFTRDDRGRRVVLERALPGGADALEPGVHRLFEARVNALSPGARAPRIGRGPGREDNDFALVICPPWQVEMPPLWTAMLAACLRQQGFTGHCHDVNTMLYRLAPAADQDLWQMYNLFLWSKQDRFEPIYRRMEPLMEDACRRIVARRPRVVGFTLTSASHLSSLRLAERIKQLAPETTIVFGGPGIYWTRRVDGVEIPDSAFCPWTGERLDTQAAVDLYLRGEADHALPRLLHHLQRGLDPLQVPGVAARRDGAWRGPLPPRRPTDLDALPLPDYGDLSLPSYGNRTAPILGSRGCILACTFCNDCRMQGTFRPRSAEHIFAELQRLNRSYGVDVFHFTDLLTNGDLGQLERLCDLIIASGLRIEWGGHALLRGGLERLLERLARAGCAELTFGVESLSQPVVDAMRKRFSVAEGLRLLRGCHQHGIKTSINLVAGFPGETPEMFRETMDNLRRAADVITRVQAINACHLTSNSPLYEHPERYAIDLGTEECWYRWRGPHGNTYEERKRRVGLLQALAAELGLTVAEQNLFDEAEEQGQEQEREREREREQRAVAPEF